MINSSLPSLKYCSCKMSNTGTCAKLATHKTKLKSENTGIESFVWRCDEHTQKSTANKKYVGYELFDQSEAHRKVNEYLTSLIGKRIKSKMHTARELEVKYLKDNGGVMCFQPHSKKWKYVYYHQITHVFENTEIS